ncbi:MAG: hypothetical protein V7742_05520 [Halioglobus sp.]
MKKLIAKLAVPVLACMTWQAQANENWDFVVEPYLIATAIEGDSAVGRIGEVDVDVDFDTILDNLDMGAMIHAEAVHKSGWGVLVDYALMDLKGDSSSARGGVADVRVKQEVAELGLIRRIQLDKYSSYDLIFGIRHWDNELRLKLIPNVDILGQTTFRAEPSWTDGYIGGRYTMTLGGKWKGMISGDVGTGDSNFTATARVGVYYSFNETWELELGYKGLWVDYEEGKEGQVGHFVYDTLTHGPLLGLRINF